MIFGSGIKQVKREIGIAAFRKSLPQRTWQVSIWAEMPN